MNPVASTQGRQFLSGKPDRERHHRQATRKRAPARQERPARRWRGEKHHQAIRSRTDHRARAIGQTNPQRHGSGSARPPLHRAAELGEPGHLPHRRSRTAADATRPERGQTMNQRRRDRTRNGRQQSRIRAGTATDHERSAAGGQI